MRARENPFRTDRIGRLGFRHPELPLERIEARLHRLGRRAAIVGPHGSGKSTLLRELGARLARRGLRVRRWLLDATGPPAATRTLVAEARRLGPRDALLFDGAGHLPTLAWWRVARASRQAGAVVVTAHAEGLLPTLLRTRTDAALLAALAGELLGPAADRLAPLLEELRARHRGNLHEVFLALYDLAARDDPRLAAVARGSASRPSRWPERLGPPA